MIKLGDLVLPDLLWINEYDYEDVSASCEKTLGGKNIVFENENYDRNIDLQAMENSGWLTKTQIGTLKQMAGVKGATYILIYESQTFSVRFRREDEPCIEVAPLIPKVDYAAGDFYIGTIKLKTV